MGEHEERVEEARKFIQDVKIAFMMYNPFFYFMLNAMEVVFVDKESDFRDAKGKVIAKTPLCVSGMKMVIFRNAMGDSIVQKNPTPTVKHEIIHIVMEHCTRGAEIIKRLFIKHNLVPTEENISNVHFFINLAMDAKDNHLLAIDGDNVSWGFTGKGMWSDKDIAEDSVEELVEMIFDTKKPQASGFGAGIDILRFVDEEGDEIDGVVLQEGDKSLKELKGKDLRDALKEKVVESIVKAKLAGTEKGGILRVLEESILLPKQQAWWLRLRHLMRSQLIKSKISDWRVVNRKLPNQIAGSRIIKKPKCVCCVDVSGSISAEEYKLFVSEILLASKEADITAIFWDSGVEEVRTVRGAKDMVKGVRGGGGTVFCPVIKELEGEKYDIMVCLTDGMWYDTDKASEAIGKLRNVYKIICTSGSVVNGFDEVIKIDMGEK